MAPGLIFITTTKGTSPQDPATRTLIKQHVMKEIGKARRKPRKVLHGKSPNKPIVASPRRPGKLLPGKATEHDISPSKVETVELTLCRNPSSEQSFSYVLGKVSQYYGADFLDTRKYRSVWGDLSQLDPAAEYTISALLTSYVSFRHPVPSANQRGFRSSVTIHNRAIHELNKRLSDPGLYCSDGVIAAIVASIIQAHLYNNRNLYSLHMKGLYVIVTQRPGGWESLGSNPKLQLLVSTADTYCALAEEKPPCLPFPTHLLGIENLGPARPRSRTSLAISSSLRRRLPHQWKTTQMFDEIVLFLNHLDPDIKAPTWDPLATGPMVIGYMHMLCTERADRAGRNDLDSEAALLECIHVALFLSLSESRRRFSLIPGTPDLLAARLHDLIENGGADWSGLSLLRFWILTAAARESKDRPLEAWFNTRLSKAGKDLSKSARAEISDMFIPNVILPWKWLEPGLSYVL